MKAEFTVSLGRKESMTSVSNMPQAKTDPMWVWLILFVYFRVFDYFMIVVLLLIVLGILDTYGIVTKSPSRCHLTWLLSSCQTSSMFRLLPESVTFNSAFGLVKVLVIWRRKFELFLVHCQTGRFWLFVIYIKRYAIDIGPRILEFFEGYYGVDYPLAKQDMAAIPDFAAGKYTKHEPCLSLLTRLSIETRLTFHLQVLWRTGVLSLTGILKKIRYI